MKITQMALAAALLTASGSASAQSATDAGCILVSNIFAKNAKEPEAQKLAQASIYFYLGRIPSGATPAQLKALFDQQAKLIDNKSAPNMMNACAKEFQAKADMVQGLFQPPQKPQQPQGR